MSIFDAEARAHADRALDAVMAQLQDVVLTPNRSMAYYYRGKIDAITTWMMPNTEHADRAEAMLREFEVKVDKIEAAQRAQEWNAQHDA